MSTSTGRRGLLPRVVGGVRVIRVGVSLGLHYVGIVAAVGCGLLSLPVLLVQVVNLARYPVLGMGTAGILMIPSTIESGLILGTVVAGTLANVGVSGTCWVGSCWLELSSCDFHADKIVINLYF